MWKSSHDAKLSSSLAGMDEIGCMSDSKQVTSVHVDGDAQDTEQTVRIGVLMKNLVGCGEDGTYTVELEADGGKG